MRHGAGTILSALGEEILDSLREVTAERLRRAADPALAAQVTAVKRIQHARFERTYADLLASARYARASRFFLEDLYGPGDFTARDEQLARIVPATVRLFPHELVATVAAVARLHSLSEQLDTLMAQACGTQPVDAESYVRAWCAVGRHDDRRQQIDLMFEVGQALDRYTRKPLLRQSLRLMAGPARAVGLSALHGFLVNGFETFREMRGAQEFLSTIQSRETHLATRMFEGLPPA